MVGDGKNLNAIADVAKDDVEWKAFQRGLSDRRRQDESVTIRPCTNCNDRSAEGHMVATAKTSLTCFIERDLLCVFRSRFGMKPVVHFKRD